MINLVKWQNDAYQIILEGTSFYYFKKMPVAFRMPADKRIIVRAERYGKTAQAFVDQLQFMGRVVTKPVDEFKQLLTAAYHKTIFSAARDIATRRMHKEQHHVTYEENHDRQPECEDAGHGG